jgi:hypothetical protein
MTRPEEPMDDRLIKMIRNLRSVPPRDEQAKIRGRAKFLAEAEVLRPTVSKLSVQRHKGWFSSIKNPTTIFQKERPPMFTALVSAIVALVLFFSGASVTAFAAQGA